jgi:hypothetical protein
VDLPPVDLVSLETLFVALNSADDHEVLAATDLLAEEGRTRLIPALILYHPSPRVVLRVLDLFATEGRVDFLPVAERLARHADAEVRAGALRARTRVRPEEPVLRSAGSDPSPLVRATAVAGLVAGGWEDEEARASLERLLADGDAETSRALARAIAAQPSPAFEDVLLRLADRAPEASHVARAMGVRSARFSRAMGLLRRQREARPRVRMPASTSSTASSATRPCLWSCGATSRGRSPSSTSPAPRRPSSGTSSRSPRVPCATASCAG